PAHIGLDRNAADLAGHVRRGCGFHIGHYYPARAFGGEAAAQSAADPVRAARYDHHFVAQLHAASYQRDITSATQAGLSFPSISIQTCHRALHPPRAPLTSQTLIPFPMRAPAPPRV